MKLLNKKNSHNSCPLFPEIFIVAEEESEKAQKYHFYTIKIYYLCILIAASLATYGHSNKPLMAGSAVFIVISIISSIYAKYSALEDTWYRCRAIAESIKTSVWHFAMNSEPYDCANNEAQRLIKQRINEILSEHGNRIPASLSVGPDNDYVTEEMERVRDSRWPKKLEYYVENRVDNQYDWYSKKAQKNEAAGQWWFKLLILTQIGACTLAIIRIPFPALILPVGVALICSGAISAWIQARRFTELSSAYKVTTRDIRELRAEADRVTDQDKLAQYVSDSENAFSREHTQWIARKDAA